MMLLSDEFEPARRLVREVPAMPTNPTATNRPLGAETASTPADTPTTATPADPTIDAEPALVADDLLVEDVSIDGMCGVY